MKVAAVALVAALAYGSILAAQTPAPSAPQTSTIFVVPPAHAACPVGIRAEYAGLAEAMRVARSYPRGIGQALHLTITRTKLDSGQPAKARFIVHGLSAKGRAIQTGSGLNQGLPSDLEKTYEVPLTAVQDGMWSVDLWVSDVTTVQSINLVSVAYSDGSTWTPSDGKVCRTVPDPMMLVGNR